MLLLLLSSPSTLPPGPGLPPSFPQPLAFPFGVPADADAATYPDPLDHVGLGLGRLLEQFKPKPLFNALIRALLAPFEEIEQTLSDLLSKRLLAGAEGEQLNVLGRVFNVDRGGRGDDAFRALIMATIATYQSSGTLPEIYAVLESLDPAAAFTATDLALDPAALRIEWTSPVLPPIPAAADDVSADLLRIVLRRARAAGVRLYFRWWPAAESELFLFASGDVVETDAAHGLADTAMTTGGALLGEVVP